MNAPLYTSRVIKGGALLSDMRLLTAFWDGSDSCAEQAIVEGPLSHLRRKRAGEVLDRVFVLRFVRSEPPDLWRPLKVWEQAGMSIEQIRPIHYYAAACADPVLGDVVTELLWPRYALGQMEVTTEDLVRFFKERPKARFAAGRWSEDTATRVAQGVLSVLRDFGVLQGAANKRIGPVLLPIPSFALLALARFLVGARGLPLLRDPTWRLFHLSEPQVESAFIEAQQRGLLFYSAAGSVVRVEFPDQSLEDYALTLAQRTH